MSSQALTATSLPLLLVAKGKVRDIYDAGITEGPNKGALLFVATDRISAFDIVLENVSQWASGLGGGAGGRLLLVSLFQCSCLTLARHAESSISCAEINLHMQGIPDKGKLLHALSTFWFQLLTPSIIGSHIIATEYDQFPSSLRDALSAVSEQVKGRSMLVKRAEVVPIEAIVRGYITGSGWSEYSKSGTVHGIQLPKGLVESQKIPDGPYFTPSTKAEQGQHDENIHPDKGESKESTESTPRSFVLT
jgi:phosphoribosylaminoimidazole-succinocarboxamide synthase